MTQSIHYTIQPIDPNAHLFAVTCTVKNPLPSGQQFNLPAWTPGSYKIRDFAKQVSHVRAHSAGREIACHKIDKHTWQCAPATDAITLSYTVYAWDLSVRSAHLDQTHATINGSSVFICPMGKEQESCILEIKRPQGEAYKTWRVATAMTPNKTAAHEFGEYIVKDYAELIDTPIELGIFVITSFTESGIPHELVFTGLAPNTDIERITQDVQRICNYYLNFFPTPHPMQRYVFIINLLDQGFGGLEHRTSCLLHFSKYNLPTFMDTTVNETYLTFLTLCSHEYLHTWLVKGIKPSVFMPYDLNHENYTELLWLFEGFTAYYEDLVLVRNGLISEQQFFNILAHKIARLWRTPGRNEQSVTQASFDAWIKFYQPDEHTANITVSYYLKGSLIAFILDIFLREQSNNQYSADTILIDLWQRYEHDKTGVPENALEILLHEKVGNALDPLIKQLLYSTDELPLTEALQKIGVLLEQRPARNAADKGEVSLKPIDIITTVPVDLGIIFDPRQQCITIQTCLMHSAAHYAGLSAGDTIIAIDNLKVEPANLTQHLARYTPGEKVTVLAFRRDQLMSFEVTLAPAMPVPVLIILDDADVASLQRRALWLEQK